MFAKRLMVLALDPGPTWMGWALLDVQHDPGVRTTFMRGGHAPCDYEAFRRTLTDAMADRGMCDGTPDACGLGPVELAVSIEAPAGYAFSPAVVPNLLRTSYIAGGMAWLARSRGLRVVEATAQQVRKVLAGKANADDQVVKSVVESNVFGAAGASNDHVRDAVAVGLLGAWVLVGQVVLPEAPAVKKRSKKKGGENGGEKGIRGRRVRGHADSKASA